ncbi:hypothetical protein HDV06_000420 [Boothiomyces sp. JEL0866]|nr:hypothetical protein HDV06_000420 [Boothiomyces sp. JEL0866]
MILAPLFAALLSLVNADSLNVIATNHYLPNGWEVFDTSKTHQLIMQNDCNLVLYSGSKPIWSSNTYIGAHDGQHKCDQAIAFMQTDGNFVVYDGNNHALWATGTQGSNFYAIVQDDGNFVIYDPGNEKAVWASNTQGQLQ